MARHRSRRARSRARHPRPANVPVTHQAPSGGAQARPDALPRSGPHAALGAAHALDLTPSSVSPGPGPGPGLADVLLELAGADPGDLRAVLNVWQREQDRVLNRAWRRPGGLARPGGV
ncbi:MAG TPA: hypothetical protein VFU88_03330 [Ktedonobacterales bacterium]|nr:hypothetical protein [Ktedonobacterales bacterium]